MTWQSSQPRCLSALSALFVLVTTYSLLSTQVIAADDSPRETQPRSAAGPSLKETYSRDFAMGVSLGGLVPHDYSPEELSLVHHHFSVLTPENAMKMGHIRRTEEEFDFAQADALVEFARENQLRVVGHTLVWARDDSTPAWIFKDGEQPANRELLLKRMREHIAAVAGRYGTAVAEWDVVNEAVDDAEGVFLRPSQWLDIAGPDFIAEAFRAAHAAAPEAVLIYNDYGTEKPAKREKMLRLLRELLEQGVPVHAVGLQGHFELDRIPLQDLEDTLVAIKGLGLKAMITELDIAVVPRSRWWADDGRHRAELAKWDPYATECPPEVLARQAEQYGELFQSFRRHADVIERVTFWNLHDGRSWLNTFPWRHTEYPLLFDRSAQPKPAFEAVLKAAQ
jgi:endo-1,4-beta-xylanase